MQWDDAGSPSNEKLNSSGNDSGSRWPVRHRLALLSGGTQLIWPGAGLRLST